MEHFLPKHTEFNLNLDPITNFFIPQYVSAHKEDLNSFLFRSDEFTNVHHGKHILFSGCSYTYGNGLELEEIWSKVLYNKILKNNQCSGYFNLGVYGHGAIHIISNLFKYFKQYGNPDVIFINLPDLPRFTLNKNSRYRVVRLEDKSFIDLVYYLTYEYYLMLETYCKSNNIKLFSFSWDIKEDKDFLFKRDKNFKSTNDFFDSYNFNTFYKIDEVEYYKEIKKILKYDKNQYSITSRDGFHPGTSFHIAYANFIYDKYIKLENNKK